MKMAQDVTTALRSPAGLRLSTGERMRVLRARATLTRREMGSLAEVSITSLGRYERDEIPAPSDVLARLALALETTTDYLLGLTEDPTVPFNHTRAVESYADAA